MAVSVASEGPRGASVRQASREVAWRPRARRRAPLCLPGERKQVAGTGQHSAGPASGLPGGLAGLPGKSLSLLLNLVSVFLFFCKFVDLLKIVRHLQKS